MRHYCLNCGKELGDKQYVCPQCHHNVYLDSFDDKMVAASASILSAINIETNTQWTKYRCGRDGASGHGYAAEDANAINDLLSFNNVKGEGRNNTKDGADRIVGNNHIQTKYCATPQASVNAAFGDNGRGNYRYYSEYGPQTLEVPADQYDRCVSLMEDKIRNGQVEGVSDPGMAKDIVKKGSCTYAQAKNIAKARNIDSLMFDAKTGTVIALSSLGVSFCVKFCLSAMSCRSQEDLKAAAQLAFLDGLKNGTITLTTTVLSMQILRTQFGRDFAAVMQHVSKSSIDSLYKLGTAKGLVHDIASGLWNKSLTGASAKGVVVKLLRTNAITGVVTFVVCSIPDTYYYVVSNSMSTPQFIKNLVVSGSSITGATVGGILGLKFGKVGAFVGSMAGGALAGLLTKAVADTIRKDDAEAMHELIKIALLELSNEYSIQSQVEFDEVIRQISLDRTIDTNLLRVMYSVGADANDDEARVNIAKLTLSYYFDTVARNRKTIKMPSEETILDNIESISFTTAI